MNNAPEELATLVERLKAHMEQQEYSYCARAEAAMTLLISALWGRTRTGNVTPLSGHSLRIGQALELMGQDLITVLAGYLHDLLEDSRNKFLVTWEILADLFGEEVANLVAACSYNATLQQADNNAANKDLVARVRGFGRPAVILKGVDFRDNLRTMHQVPKKWHEEASWFAEQWLSLLREFAPDYQQLIAEIELEHELFRQRISQQPA